MSRVHSYINTSLSILSTYSGKEPFSVSLKKYFDTHKKHGSADRKIISHLCYCYFRAARLFEQDTPELKVLKSLFLCSSEPHFVLTQLKPEWNSKLYLPVQDKLHFLDASKSIIDLFPFHHQLSHDIDAEVFAASLVVQPHLYIRIRPGYQQSVQEKLSTNAIPFSYCNDLCLALPNSTKIDKSIALNKEAVIQDYNSQQAGALMELAKQKLPAHKFKVWDCCAGSGGKSIMAKDILGDIELTVSDIRESILANLKKRFHEAGIHNYQSFLADLSVAKPGLSSSQYSLIIADVPCTGSGTWSRTPEQLFGFDEEKIDLFAALQKKIAENAIACLQPGGYFLYITCSVFKKENEEVVSFIQNKFRLVTVKTQLFRGYDKKADTIFASLLTKPLQTY